VEYVECVTYALRKTGEKRGVAREVARQVKRERKRTGWRWRWIRRQSQLRVPCMIRWMWMKVEGYR
jgi:hypothetical protein